jgi:hypothetical protein
VLVSRGPDSLERLHSDWKHSQHEPRRSSLFFRSMCIGLDYLTPLFPDQVCTL